LAQAHRERTEVVEEATGEAETKNEYKAEAAVAGLAEAVAGLAAAN
jgi:predicted transcriptional regulator